MAFANSITCIPFALFWKWVFLLPSRNLSDTASCVTHHWSQSAQSYERKKAVFSLLCLLSTRWPSVMQIEEYLMVKNRKNLTLQKEWICSYLHAWSVSAFFWAFLWFLFARKFSTSIRMGVPINLISYFVETVCILFNWLCPYFLPRIGLVVALIRRPLLVVPLAVQMQIYTKMCKNISNMLSEIAPAGRRTLRREIRLPFLYIFTPLLLYGCKKRTTFDISVRVND